VNDAKAISLNLFTLVLFLAGAFSAGWFIGAGRGSDTIDRLIAGNTELGDTVTHLRAELERATEQIEILTRITGILESTNQEIESNYFRLAEIQGVDAGAIEKAKESLRRTKEIIERLRDLLDPTHSDRDGSGTTTGDH
jgi:hypothetical protein